MHLKVWKVDKNDLTPLRAAKGRAITFVTCLPRQILSQGVYLLAFISFFACQKIDDLPACSSEDCAEILQELMLEDDLPMLAIGIVQEDTLIWYIGLSNPEITSAAAPSEVSNFMLASISKVITATAIMQLVERNQLDPNVDISSYLPFEVKHPDHSSVPITTHHLLTHTSGLAWPTNEEDPRFNDRSPFDSAPELQPWLQSYILPGGSLYRTATWTPSMPGERYQYTNVGVALLGLIVQSITNMSFDMYCQDQIFQPLEMENSGFRWSDIDGSLAMPLFYEDQTIDPYSVPHYPASTFRSTLEDFSKYMIAILQDGTFGSAEILSEKSVTDMLSVKVHSEDVSYLWQQMGDGWIGHTGGYWGVSSSFAIERSKKLGFIMVTNTNGKTSLYPNGRIFEMIKQKALSHLE